MQPASHGHASGTGPPARRSLLGSARAQQSSSNGRSNNYASSSSSSTGAREGDGVVHVNGNAARVNGSGGPPRMNGLGKSAHGQGSGVPTASGSTVPQKRKLGMAGASGSGGSKARREEGRVGVRIGAALHSSGGAGGGASSDGVGAGVSAGGDAGTGTGGEEGAGDDIIRCICGSSTDDGFSIACDGCGRWCHCACFAIAKDRVPDNWWCWKCRPGDHLDLPPNGYAPPPLPAAPPKSRRRASISNKRPTTTVPADASPPLPNGSNAHIDDMEDERTQYVQIEDDIVPHAATQRKLRTYAAQWRGVSALEPTPPTHALGHTPFVFGGAPPAPHPTLLHPAAAAYSALPPTYALHTALPAPPHTLLARYPALITPTSAYLRAPPNGYAHAGAPKRFVHLVGPPLDVALDARGAGGRGRWVRSGCWPNAEVRAFVCDASDAQAGKDAKGKGKKREGRDEEDDAPQTHFGIFATRALKQGEEIVVGWEWDDANAVHRVGEVAGTEGLPLPLAPTPIQRHLIAQLANILHALGGSGTAECACATSSIAVPSAHKTTPVVSTLGLPASLSSSSHLHPPKEKERRASPGMENGVGARAVSVAASVGKEEVEAEEARGECVIRAMERVVFPPAPAPVGPVEEMEVDIEGVTPPRVPSPSPFPASSSFAASTSSYMPTSSSASTLAPSSSYTLPASSSAAPTSHPPAASTSRTAAASKSVSSTSTTTPTVKHKRLAGPGVPPPSPEASAAQPHFHPYATSRWGPLIGAERGVRAVERVRGSGGWGGVVLDASAGYGHAARAWAGDEYGYGQGYGEYRDGGHAYAQGFGAGYASTSAAASAVASTSASGSKPYAVVERGGGWDVVHEPEYGGGRGGRRDEGTGRDAGDAEEEEDVDVVGDADGDTMTRKRDRIRRRERDRAVQQAQSVEESVCPPKMRKRWKDASGAAVPVSRAQAPPPPRVDKGKGKAVLRDSAMDVDAGERPPLPPRLPLAPPPPPPHFQFQPPLLPPQLPPGTSPSTSFAALSLQSPHPSGPRPAWFSVGAGANVEVLEHGDSAGVRWGRRDTGDGRADMAAGEAVDVAAVATVVSASPPAEEMHVDANVSPRVHFVEPVADAVEVDSPADVHVQEEPELDEDPPMAIGEEEPYRPSPQSPSPAPESEDELEVVPVITKDVEPGTAPVDDVETMRETEASPVAVEPPSPNWDPTASLSPDVPVPAPLARDPSPAPAVAAPAPAPPAKVSFKEWQARRKLERAKVEEQEERDREMQRGQEMEREKEQREREKDGADKENDAVPSKAEDGLTRILDGIRRSAVGDKPPSVEVVQQDVEMPDAVPVEIAPPPLDGLQPKEKAPLLTMTAFVAGGNAHLLSPLAVPSTVESRTPSPRLTNGIKREVSPLAATVSAPSPPPPTAPAPPPPPPSVLHSPQAVRLPSPSFMSAPPPPLFVSPSPQRRRSPPSPSPPRKFLPSPPPPPALESPRVRRSPSPLSPPRSVLPSPPPPSVLQSPKAPHYPPSSFTSNGVPRPTAFLPKPLPSSSFTTSRLPQPRSRGPPSPLPQPRPSPAQFRARAPSQEEGEILPNSSPPPTPMRVPRFGSQPTPARMSPFAASTSPFATPNGPPTQPRSHQLGRMPPSAPKALREAQNPNAMALGGGSGGPPRGAQRFNGMGPQTIPSTVLEPQPRGRRGGRWGKQRQRGT